MTRGVENISGRSNMSNSTVVAPAKAIVNVSAAPPATTPVLSPPPAYLVPSASSPEGTLVIAKTQSSDISWIAIVGVLVAFLVVAVITLIWFWYKKREYKKALQEHRDLYEENEANFNREGEVDEEQGIPSKTGQKILSDFERALASQSASKKFDGGDDGDDATSGARIVEQGIPVYTRDKHVVEGFRKKDSGGFRNKVLPGDFNWKQEENFSDELFYKGEKMGVRYSRAELGNIDFLTKIPSSEKVASKVGRSESESASLLGTLNRSHTIAASPAREEERSKIGWKSRTLSLPAFHHRSLQGSRDTSVNMKGENRAEAPRTVIFPLTPHPHALPSSPSHRYSSTAFGDNLAPAPLARVSCWKASRLSVQSNAALNNPTFIVPPSTPPPLLPLPATLGEADEHGRTLKGSKKAESKWAIASYCPSTPPPPIPVPFLSPLAPPSQEHTQSLLLATSLTLSTSPSSPSSTLGADGSPSSGLSHANFNEGGDLSSQPPPPPPPPPPPLPTLSCRKFINLPAPDDPMKLTPPPSPPNPHEERKLTPPVSPECPQDGRKITPPPSPIPPFPTLPRKSVTPPPSPSPPVMPSSASKPKLAALILPGRPDLGADNVEGFRINRRSPKQPQKMRPLHWEKLKPESHKSMVWDNITNSMELDEEMIEHMFGVTTRASEDEGPKQSASTVTIERAEMLYPRKALNIAIQLRARGLSRIEVRNALLEGEGLSQEILELLVKMAPTDDEMTKFQGYHGDPTLLGPADRFVQGILQIPSAFERLNSMLYRASFSEELTQLQCTITTLEMACKELKSSRTFTKLLEAVLKTGNRLNTGTFRGDAKAFKLDTLLKLADVKGVDGKTTLLHFLIKEIVKAEAFRAARLAGFHDSSTPSSTWSSLCPSPTCTSPSSPLSHFARGMEAELNRCQSEISNSSSLGGFRRIGMDVVRGIPNELDHVRKAGGMDISTIRLGVSRLQTGLQDMKTTLEKLHEPSEGVGIGIRTTTYDLTDDVFSDRMAGFVEDAEAKLSVIQKDLEIVLASAKDISVYFYGEADTAKSTQPLKVFMVMRDFLAMLEQACEDVMKGNAPLPPPSTGPSRRNSLTLPM